MTRLISLGGVHRGGENCMCRYSHFIFYVPDASNVAMDVSADLHELTRCPVGMVSSGVKSILDIKKLVPISVYWHVGCSVHLT